MFEIGDLVSIRDEDMTNYFLGDKGIILKRLWLKKAGTAFPVENGFYVWNINQSIGVVLSEHFLRKIEVER